MPGLAWHWLSSPSRHLHELLLKARGELLSFLPPSCTSPLRCQGSDHTEEGWLLGLNAWSHAWWESLVPPWQETELGVL